MSFRRLNAGWVAHQRIRVLQMSLRSLVNTIPNIRF